MSTSSKEIVIAGAGCSRTAFLAFLNNTQEAFNIMTQHAAKRRAVRIQPYVASETAAMVLTHLAVMPTQALAWDARAVESTPVDQAAVHQTAAMCILDVISS